MAGKESAWQGALAAIDQSSIDKLKGLKQEHDKLSERLQPGVNVPIKPGDKLRFGMIEVEMAVA